MQTSAGPPWGIPAEKNRAGPAIHAHTNIYIARQYTFTRTYMWGCTGYGAYKVVADIRATLLSNIGLVKSGLCS